MAPRYEIMEGTIPKDGITKLRSLKYGSEIERMVAPQIATSFRTWLEGIARAVAKDWPKKSGKSARDIATSARVRGYAYLDSIRGYFLVDMPVMANEYGTKVAMPRNARAIAIPILDGLFQDGSPKRLGPNSWRSLGTFIYRSRRTGRLYIAYKAGGKLKIIYLLVDKRAALKALRIFRHHVDTNLGMLYREVELAVQTAIVAIYETQFIDALNSIDNTLRMRRVPSIIPDAELHAGRLMPRFK